MKHFSLAEWADFARIPGDSEKRQGMQAHLDSGCDHCRGIVQTWARVKQMAQQESNFEPPDAAIRLVKSRFTSAKERPFVVQLLFDSFHSPAFAGVRSAGANPRQMLYGIGTYRIDLRMEPQMDSDKVQLVGQILNSADPIKSGTQATVKLIRGRRILTQSQTNSLGEFCLECSLEGDLQLLLGLPRSRDVKIPLLVPSKSSLTGRLEHTDSAVVTDGKRRRKRSTRKED